MIEMCWVTTGCFHFPTGDEDLRHLHIFISGFLVLQISSSRADTVKFWCLFHVSSTATSAYSWADFSDCVKFFQIRVFCINGHRWLLWTLGWNWPGWVSDTAWVTWLQATIGHFADKVSRKKLKAESDFLHITVLSIWLLTRDILFFLVYKTSSRNRGCVSVLEKVSYWMFVA